MSKKSVSLDPPPVGELDKEVAALDTIDAQVILLLVVVYANVKNSAGI